MSQLVKSGVRSLPKLFCRYVLVGFVPNAVLLSLCKFFAILVVIDFDLPCLSKYQLCRKEKKNCNRRLHCPSKCFNASICAVAIYLKNINKKLQWRICNVGRSCITFFFSLQLILTN